MAQQHLSCGERGSPGDSTWQAASWIHSPHSTDVSEGLSSNGTWRIDKPRETMNVRRIRTKNSRAAAWSTMSMSHSRTQTRRQRVSYRTLSGVVHCLTSIQRPQSHLRGFISQFSGPNPGNGQSVLLPLSLHTHKYIQPCLRFPWRNNTRNLSARIISSRGDWKS